MQKTAQSDSSAVPHSLLRPRDQLPGAVSRDGARVRHQRRVGGVTTGAERGLLDFGGGVMAGSRLLAAHSRRGMGGGMLRKVLGCLPDRRNLSWPFMPPEIHLPSCLPRQACVRRTGADSA